MAWHASNRAVRSPVVELALDSEGTSYRTSAQTAYECKTEKLKVTITFWVGVIRGEETSSEQI